MEQLTYIEIHPLRTVALLIGFLLFVAIAIVRMNLKSEELDKRRYYSFIAATFLLIAAMYFVAIQLNLNVMTWA